MNVKNIAIYSGIGGCVLLVGSAAYLLIAGMNKFNQKFADAKTAEDALTRIYHKDNPFPNQSNIQIIKKNANIIESQFKTII